jgi:hypothetical protein
MLTGSGDRKESYDFEKGESVHGNHLRRLRANVTRKVQG